MPPKGWRSPAKEVRDAQLAKMYLDGVPLKEMAAHFALDLASVKRIVKQMELPRRRRVGTDPENSKAIKKRWRRANSAQVNGQQQRWHGTLRGRYSALGTLAKSRRFPIELTFGQYVALVEGGCNYCGGDCLSTSTGGYGIDRVDSSKGYTVKNSVACCYVCNQMKMDMCVDDFYAHIASVLGHRDAGVQLAIFNLPMKRNHVGRRKAS